MDSEKYIRFRFLRIVLVISLLIPVWFPAKTNADIHIVYANVLSPQNTLYRPSDEVVEKVRQDYLASLPKPKVQTTYKSSGNACSCVLWAQAHGLNISGYGLAKNYPVNSQIPAAEGFVVTYEGSAGHIAHYTLSGLYLVLDEANYVRCTETHGRIIPINYPLIKGYIN